MDIDGLKQIVSDYSDAMDQLFALTDRVGVVYETSEYQRRFKRVCDLESVYQDAYRSIANLGREDSELNLLRKRYEYIYLRRHPMGRPFYTIKQPVGGYLSPHKFEKVELDDDYGALPLENVKPMFVGTMVEKLTAAMARNVIPADVAFGYRAKSVPVTRFVSLSDSSIRDAFHGYGYSRIDIDDDCVQHIRIMVKRSLQFLDKYAPNAIHGFRFCLGLDKQSHDKHFAFFRDGNEIDFLTKDTIWDFKVTSDEPKSTHTLQLLVYWRMGLYTHPAEFESIKYIGIFNPRKNIVYRYSVDDIPLDVIDKVEKNVIGIFDSHLKEIKDEITSGHSVTVNISDKNIAEDRRKLLTTYITKVQAESDEIVKCQLSKVEAHEKKLEAKNERLLKASQAKQQKQKEKELKIAQKVLLKEQKKEQDEKKTYTELISNKQRMERLKTGKANSLDYKKLIRSHTSNPIVQDYIKEKKWSTITQALSFMTDKTLICLGKKLWNAVKNNFKN